MDNENTELNAEQIDDLRCFKIPLMGSDDTVVIYENELPDDINKIIQLLQSEVVPLCHWIQIAAEYFRQKKYEQFHSLLDHLITGNIPEQYTLQYEELATIKLYLLYYYTFFDTDKEDTKRKYDQLNAELQGLVNGQMNTLKISYLLIMAYREYSLKNTQLAIDKLNELLSFDKNNILVSLALAQIYLEQGEYKKSLNCYTHLIEELNYCNNDIRLGLAICLYYLDKSDLVLALEWIDRILTLDPNDAYSLLIKGIIYKNQTNVDIRVRTYESMNYIKQAYLLNHQLPLAIYHITEHALYSWTPLPDVQCKLVPNSSLIETTSSLKSIVSIGDMVQLNGDSHSIFTVENVSEQGLVIREVYQGPTLESASISIHQYQQCLKLCQEAIQQIEYNMSTVTLYDHVINQEILSLLYEIVGRLYLQVHNVKDSLAMLTTSLKYDEKNIIALYLKGLNLLSGNKSYSDSLEIFLQVNQFGTVYVDVLYRIILIYIKCKKTDLALNTINQLLTIDSSHIGAKMLRAYLTQTSSNPEDVKQASYDYLEVLDVYNKNNIPLSPELLNNISTSQYILEEYQKCIPFYKNCIHFNNVYYNIDESDENVYMYHPKNITITYNISCAYRGLGQYDKANQILKRLIETNPYYFDSYISIAENEMKQAHYQEAIHYLNECIRLCEPHLPSSIASMKYMEHYCLHHWTSCLSLLSTIFKELNNYEQCSLSLKTIFKRYPDYKDLYVQLQLITTGYELPNYNANDSSNIEKLRKMIKKSPDNIYIVNTLGYIYLNINKVDQAEFVFNLVHSSMPLYEECTYNLAFSYILQSKYLQAIRLFEIIRKNNIFNSDSNIYLYLSYAYYLYNQYTKALASLQKGLFNHPTNAVMWYDLAITSKSLYSSIRDKGSFYHPRPYDDQVHLYPCCNDENKKSAGCMLRGSRTKEEMIYAKQCLDYAISLFDVISKKFTNFSQQSNASKQLILAKTELATCSIHLKAEEKRERLLQTIKKQNEVAKTSILNEVEPQSQQSLTEKEKQIIQKYKEEVQDHQEDYTISAENKKKKKADKTTEFAAENEVDLDADIKDKVNELFNDDSDEEGSVASKRDLKEEKTTSKRIRTVIQTDSEDEETKQIFG